MKSINTFLINYNGYSLVWNKEVEELSGRVRINQFKTIKISRWAWEFFGKVKIVGRREERKWSAFGKKKRKSDQNNILTEIRSRNPKQ